MSFDITNNLNDKILDIINRCSYDMYVIHKYTNMICTCVNHETDQADIYCKKCLGTKYKISIRKIKAASQDSNIPTTLRTESFYVARNVYMKSNIECLKDDIIIDNDDIYFILDIQNLFSLKGSVPYKKAIAVKKKFDTKIFIKNFKEIIKKSR